MSRRKLANKNIRNITKTGSSLGITLPIDMLKKLGWRKRQKVVVSLRGKTITIKDWPSRR